MKVCFISHSAERGGGEITLLELIEALSHRGVQPVCFLPQSGPLEELLVERNIEVVIFPYRRWIHIAETGLERARRVLLRLIPSAFRMAAAIRRSGCDIVYTNTVTVGVGALAARIAGKPHVWHIHEFGYDDHQFHFDLGESLSRRLIGLFSAACIANSRAVADDYRPFLGGTELEVVYNSVEVPPSANNPLKHVPWRDETAIRCCVVGSVAPGKGQEDAVKAMALLAEMKVPAELLVIGGCSNPEYGRHIGELIEQRHLEDRVHVIGWTDEPLPLMNSADVVLVCARREAFGRTTVEAMKLGKPVIATRSGGTPELVQEGTTGFLYDPEDVPALADRIRELHDNRALCDELGSKAESYARNLFTQEKFGAEVEAVLRRVLH